MNWMVGLAVLVLAVALAAPMVMWRRRRAAGQRDAAEVWLTGDPGASRAESDLPATMRDGDDPSDGDGGDAGSDSGGSDGGGGDSGGSESGGSEGGGSDSGGSASGSGD